MDEEWLVVVEFIKSLSGWGQARAKVGARNERQAGLSRYAEGKFVIVCLCCVEMTKPSSRLELVTNFSTSILVYVAACADCSQRGCQVQVAQSPAFSKEMYFYCLHRPISSRICLYPGR